MYIYIYTYIYIYIYTHATFSSDGSTRFWSGVKGNPDGTQPLWVLGVPDFFLRHLGGQQPAEDPA